MKVRLTKPLRYGVKFFEAGEVGETVDVPKPAKWNGELAYGFYVRFGNFPPIGVFQHEVEILDTGGDKS